MGIRIKVVLICFFLLALGSPAFSGESGQSLFKVKVRILGDEDDQTTLVKNSILTELSKIDDVSIVTKDADARFLINIILLSEPSKNVYATSVSFVEIVREHHCKYYHLRWSGARLNHSIEQLTESCGEIIDSFNSKILNLYRASIKKMESLPDEEPIIIYE